MRPEEATALAAERRSRTEAIASILEIAEKAETAENSTEGRELGVVRVKPLEGHGPDKVERR
jgi:hypothetical protein